MVLAWGWNEVRLGRRGSLGRIPRDTWVYIEVSQGAPKACIVSICTVNTKVWIQRV